MRSVPAAIYLMLLCDARVRAPARRLAAAGRVNRPRRLRNIGRDTRLTAAYR